MQKIDPRTAGLLLGISLFFSGAAALVYELVWIRQLLVVFGSTTYSVAAVLAAFLGGMAVGSYFLGKLADKMDNPLRLYAACEVLTGLAVLFTGWGFERVRQIYELIFRAYLLSPGQEIAIKFGLAAAAILPAAIVMGGTLPAAVKFLSSRGWAVAAGVGKLYAVNTWGGLAGVLVSGAVLIEVVGLSGSVKAAAVTNLVIGGVVYWVSRQDVGKKKWGMIAKQREMPGEEIEGRKRWVVIGVFMVSGMAALAYEILWTRLLLPAVGTFVYAFAFMLALYLAGIAIGSRLFELYLSQKPERVKIFGWLEIAMGVMAVMSIVANRWVGRVMFVRLGLTILPATIVMGMLFPLVVKILTRRGFEGKGTGLTYLVNTAGTIGGVFLPTFFLIPVMGVGRAIATLAIVNVVCGVWLIYMDGERLRLRLTAVLAGVVVVGVGIFIWKYRPDWFWNYETSKLISSLRKAGGYKWMMAEDEAANVVGVRGYQNGIRNLIIDGVPTTHVGLETSLLAHIPLRIKPEAKNMLIVAFGMGTTFRSGLLHDGLSVDAVELVPSVPGMMGLFHDDAEEVLANPRGRVIINDGRNYVRLTDKKYDVIVVDPPPPVNASGTTVLYSREFYEDIKTRLKPGGIFGAWFFRQARVDDFKMLWRSFYEVFPHIIVLRSPTGTGYYLLGSNEEVIWSDERIWGRGLPEFIWSDISSAWQATLAMGLGGGKITKDDLKGMYMGDEKLVERFTQGAMPVTDDRPRSEYFLLRAGKMPGQVMADDWLKVE